MIHPSYRELMEKINEVNDAEGKPEITSRYSVVIAASKRARQLTNGAEPLAETNSGKPLSVAVEELYEGKVRLNMTEPETAKESEVSDEAQGEAEGE